MLVNTLQGELQQIYEIYTDEKISDYINSSSLLTKEYCAQSNINETVLLLERDDCIDISVIFNEHIIELLEHNKLSKFNLESFCYLLEGISHFLYLVHNCHHDKKVTMIEMELQAEIDKFIYLSMLNHSMDKNDLHALLFSDITYVSSLSTECKQRYETANFYAAKYTHYILRNFHASNINSSLKKELRRFYRMTLQDKMHHINSIH